jgi:hypothetical protein
LQAGVILLQTSKGKECPVFPQLGSVWRENSDTSQAGNLSGKQENHKRRGGNVMACI